MLATLVTAVINGLRGVNVEVYVIGSTTCGKPYGFYPTDNCGTTYFSIQFRGVNALGFGDYTDEDPDETVVISFSSPRAIRMRSRSSAVLLVPAPAITT